MPKATHMVTRKVVRNNKGSALRVRRASSTMQSTRPQGRQRSYKRMRYMVEVMFGTQVGSFKGLLHNLSRSGAYIETADAIPVGARVLATIPFRQKVGWVSVAGRVVRRDNGGIALRFSR